MKSLNFATASPDGSWLAALQARGVRAEGPAKPLASGGLILISAALASAALIFDPASELPAGSVTPPMSLFVEVGTTPQPPQPGPNPPPG